jgi:hypothetical protein
MTAIFRGLVKNIAVYYENAARGKHKFTMVGLGGEEENPESVN